MMLRKSEFLLTATGTLMLLVLLMDSALVPVMSAPVVDPSGGEPGKKGEEKQEPANQEQMDVVAKFLAKIIQYNVVHEIDTSLGPNEVVDPKLAAVLALPPPENSEERERELAKVLATLRAPFQKPCEKLITEGKVLPSVDCARFATIMLDSLAQFVRDRSSISEEALALEVAFAIQELIKSGGDRLLNLKISFNP